MLILAFSIEIFANPFAYVPNEKDGTVSVIDTTTDTIVKTLPKKGVFGKKIQAVALSQDGNKLFVVVRDKNSVAVVDLVKGKQERLIKVGDEPEGITVSPDGSILAACLEEENAVSFVDLKNYKVTDTSKTQGKNPEHCEFSIDGKWLLASNEKSGDVDVFDVASRQSVHLIKATKHLSLIHI